MKKILLILLCLLVFSGCSKNIKSDENVDEVSKLMSENEYVIVDVRTSDEYKTLHVVDSVNIPLDEIDDNIDLDKKDLIFVYCKSGNRSARAKKVLTDLGYNVYDLGGLENINLPKE